MTRRGLTYLIAGVLLAACSLVVWKSELWVPLVYRVEYREELIQDREGIVRVVRSRCATCSWSSRRVYESFHLGSGFMHYSGADGAEAATGTTWDSSGKVLSQIAPSAVLLESPWLWGVTDQTQPDPPAWFYDDSLFEEAKRSVSVCRPSLRGT